MNNKIDKIFATLMRVMGTFLTILMLVLVVTASLFAMSIASNIGAVIMTITMLVCGIGTSILLLVMINVPD